jgi:hypothetical protein
MFITIESAAGSTIAAPSPDAHGDQERVGRRECARERGAGEHREPEHQDASAAEQVGGTAAEEQEAAERQPIRSDDPPQVRLAEVELCARSSAARR